MEKKEDDLKKSSFEAEIKKLMKKELKNVFKKAKKSANNGFTVDPQADAYQETSTEILQELADLSDTQNNKTSEVLTHM